MRKNYNIFKSYLLLSLFLTSCIHLPTNKETKVKDESKVSYNSSVEQIHYSLRQVGSFIVDQFTNNWHSSHLVFYKNSLYITAYDINVTQRFGTILRLNSTSGKAEKNLGVVNLNIYNYLMDATVQGITIHENNLFIVSLDKTYSYNLESKSKETIQQITNVGGRDIVFFNNSFYIVNLEGNLEKTELNFKTRVKIANIQVTGGIDVDDTGIYFVSGNRIKQFTSNNEVTDILDQSIYEPIDIAVDKNSKSLYVLEKSLLKKFDLSGKMLGIIRINAIRPSNLIVDDRGYIYIADSGDESHQSRILKFEASLM